MSEDALRLAPLRSITLVGDGFPDVPQKGTCEAQKLPNPEIPVFEVCLYL